MGRHFCCHVTCNIIFKNPFENCWPNVIMDFCSDLTREVELFLCVCEMGPWGLFQCRKVCLFSGSRRVWKSRDQYLKLLDRSGIAQAALQRCCGEACQISDRSVSFKPEFEALRDLGRGRVFLYWNGAQVVLIGSRIKQLMYWRN